MIPPKWFLPVASLLAKQGDVVSKYFPPVFSNIYGGLSMAKLKESIANGNAYFLKHERHPSPSPASSRSASLVNIPLKRLQEPLQISSPSCTVTLYAHPQFFSVHTPSLDISWNLLTHTRHHRTRADTWMQTHLLRQPRPRPVQSGAQGAAPVAFRRIASKSVGQLGLFYKPPGLPIVNHSAFALTDTLESRIFSQRLEGLAQHMPEPHASPSPQEHASSPLLDARELLLDELRPLGFKLTPALVSREVFSWDAPETRARRPDEKDVRQVFYYIPMPDLRAIQTAVLAQHRQSAREDAVQNSVYLSAIRLREQGLVTRLDTVVKGHVLAALDETSLSRLEQKRARGCIASKYEMLCLADLRVARALLLVLRDQSVELQRHPKTGKWEISAPAAGNVAAAFEESHFDVAALHDPTSALHKFAEQRLFEASVTVRDAQTICLKFSSLFTNAVVPMVKPRREEDDSGSSEAKLSTTEIYLAVHDLVECEAASPPSRSPWKAQARIVRGARMQVRAHLAFLNLPVEGDSRLLEEYERMARSASTGRASEVAQSGGSESQAAEEEEQQRAEIAFECIGYEIDGEPVQVLPTQ